MLKIYQCKVKGQFLRVKAYRQLQAYNYFKTLDGNITLKDVKVVDCYDTNLKNVS